MIAPILLALTLTPAQVPAATWSRGLSTDPAYFPIAVWLQDPRNAGKYKAAGINLYVGLWRGPTDAQLDALRKAGMPVICAQTANGLKHIDDPTIVAWMHGDEPDNAQEVRDPKTGQRGYGPPIKPSKIVEDYERLRKADPSRPILLNLGQGVANDDWKGRGPGASLDDYPGYVKGSDIVSFDVYPVAGLGPKVDGREKLWYVAKGVDRLRKWTDGKKRIWNCIECTRISDPNAKATPSQVKAEVWMSLIHGSTGLIYFVHQFAPKFNEHALLDDPEMLAGVTAINARIQALAPALNSPTIEGELKAVSSEKDAPIAAMLKRVGTSRYVFTVGMRNAKAEGTFTLKGLKPGTTIKVLDENRTIRAEGETFADPFEPYGVHLYEIAD